MNKNKIIKYSEIDRCKNGKFKRVIELILLSGNKLNTDIAFGDREKIDHDK